MARNRYPGVFKRGSSWSFRAQFDDGVRRHGVSGSNYASAKEANDARSKALRDAKAMAARGGRVDSTVTVGDYLAGWLEDHVRTVRPTTETAYRWRVSRILDHPVAGKKLRALTEQDCRRLFADLRDGSPTHATLMALVGVFQTALNAAVRAGLLAVNPASQVRVARTQPRFEAKAWSTTEALAFLDHRRRAEDPLFDVWYLALVTGMRKGELHGLRREDVDLDRGLLHVRRQRTQIPGGIIEQAPKTSGSEAPVHLDARTIELLRAHDYGDHGYFVSDPRSGKPYVALSTFRLDWVRAVKDAGLPAIRFHDLRHTSASLLAAAGVPLIGAQARLRHWSQAMTAHYTHALDSSHAEVADRIGDVLAPALGDEDAA